MCLKMNSTTPLTFRTFFALCFFMLTHSKGEVAVVHVAIEGNVRFPICEGCPRMVNGLLAIRKFCSTNNGSYESEVWFSFTSLEHKIAPLSGGISLEIDDDQVSMITCSTGPPARRTHPRLIAVPPSVHNDSNTVDRRRLRRCSTARLPSRRRRRRRLRSAGLPCRRHPRCAGRGVGRRARRAGGVPLGGRVLGGDAGGRRGGAHDPPGPRRRGRPAQASRRRRRRRFPHPPPSPAAAAFSARCRNGAAGPSTLLRCGRGPRGVGRARV
jgi:hypothetical protein